MKESVSKRPSQVKSWRRFIL